MDDQARRDAVGMLETLPPSVLAETVMSGAPARDLEETGAPVASAAAGPRAGDLEETRAPAAGQMVLRTTGLPWSEEPAGIEGDEDDAPPGRIGRFVVLRRIGRGGMGVVYAAYDEALDRKVAIKLLHEHDAGGGDRLLREAQALARLSHPNVVGVYEVDRALGSIYIAMEFVVGATLREWLAARQRTLPEIVDVFTQAGRGLAAAHAVGLIHRDFKPDNVMVGDDGRVRVFDFGLARSVGAQRSEERAEESRASQASKRSSLRAEMTIDGSILGTPAYMAPEQYLGGATDARTDVFAFCVALHEALYRQRPFAGATFQALRESVCRGAVASPPPDASVPSWLRL